MSKTITKLIPYFLVLIIMVGLFAPMVQVYAQEAGAPVNPPAGGAPAAGGTPPAVQPPATNAPPAAGTPATPKQTLTLTTTGGSALADNNGSCLNLVTGNVEDCLVKITYYLFYVLPSLLLTLVAKLFNILLSLTLSSPLYNASFVAESWTVVRDLSNIFFILILLYVAIQTILGLGHETKKIIVQVIVMALLINFSMFFAKVVIDSSNILALVFYNKIDSKTNDYIPSTNVNKIGVQEKDFTGAMVSAFDPTRLMTAEFFKKAKEKTQSVGVGTLGTAGYVAGGAYIGSAFFPIVGTAIGAGVGYGVSKVVGLFITTDKVPPGLMIGIIISAGLVMFFAAYCFFVAGMSFLSRLIELWILIIFSPFAFMSFTLPKLSGIPSIGWDEWLKRLLKLSFMAPVFMFFLYLIFKLINTNLFQTFMDRTYDNQGTLEAMVLIILPSLVILILLNRATKFAKDASGELGGMVIGAGKMAAGLAVGGAALGGAALLRGSVGAFMKGASTGDTAANRIAANSNILNNPTASKIAKMKAGIDLGAGKMAQLGIGRFTSENIQNWVGSKINDDQTHVEGAAHARHTLDETANTLYQGRSYEKLSGPERIKVQNRIDQDILTRNKIPIQVPVRGANNQPVMQNGQPVLQAYDYGNKQKFSELSDDAKTALTASLTTMTPTQRAAISHGSIQTITESKIKQGVVSTLMQASRTGSYDVRNIAKLIASEQSTGFNKLTIGLMAAVAMGMRGGLKTAEINHGEGQGSFFKDLGNTLTDALKSAKISVDLSHVGEEKKEDGKGGGGHH